MSALPKTSPSVDPTIIGECAATQPLSGNVRVDETTAVNSHGRGGFVRSEDAQKISGK